MKRKRNEEQNNKIHKKVYLLSCRGGVCRLRGIIQVGYRMSGGNGDTSGEFE